MSQLNSQAGGIPTYSVAFLFYEGLQLIRWGLPTLGRAICFIVQLIQMLISRRNILTEIPRIMFSKCLDTRGPFKVTHKLNHYSPIFPAAQRIEGT